ncbi:MAG: cation:dicarboxylase symporter family transporter, partial [Parachlamydiales bacterium]
GIETFRVLSYFSFFVLLALAFHFFIVLPLILRLIAKVSPLAHYKAMLPAIITAFSTSSSSATLPVTMECLEKNASVPNKIASLVAPLATSVNLTGTAIFVFMSSAFIAKISGLPLDFYTQLSLFLLTFFISFGVAPIPSGCLIATMIVLKALGLNGESVAIIVAIDRFLDMFRTTVNVFGTSVSTVLVGRLVGEKAILKKDQG